MYMVTRFINDLKKLLNGRDVKFLPGVVDIDLRLDRRIELTVFGESVVIEDSDFGELTTLCYSRGSLIREMYEIIDYGDSSIMLYWGINDWVLDCSNIPSLCLNLTWASSASRRDYDIYWEIIKKR